jgi:hypothetical protein
VRHRQERTLSLVARHCAAADETQVAQTLATLPFARFFDVDVYPTAPPDAAEAAHRARM